MFSGIITDIGHVLSIEQRGDWRLWITCGFDLDAIPLGASIAHNGACLTVAEKRADSYAVDVSAETLSKTTIGKWREGTPINLEMSLRLGDEIDGHLVYGHVDGVATVQERTAEGDSTRFFFEAPADLMRFVAPKGSVAVNGVSLTVNEVEDARFGVNIVPYTAEKTTFHGLQVSDRVNLEIDMLARYVARLLESRT